MFFKYVVTFALDHGNIGKHLERIRRIEPSQINTRGKKEIFLWGQMTEKV